jgi:ArsR family transcriptional regulator
LTPDFKVLHKRLFNREVSIFNVIPIKTTSKPLFIEMTQKFLDNNYYGSKIIFKRVNMITKQYNSQIQVFKLLSHPTRIAIMEILRQGEECVCHMEAILGHRQAYLSQQLAVLREAEIIQDRRDGWNIFYRVVQPDIYQVLDAIHTFTGQSSNIIEPKDKVCPCPHCNPEEIEH